MAALKIGQLARRTDMSIETIRYYERRGLIAEPPRRASGYRQYPEDSVRRLRFIRRAKALGFSLREIGELMSLQSSSRACAEVQTQIAEKVADLEHRIRDLRTMKTALQELSKLCAAASPTRQCPFLDLLEDGVIG